MNIDEVRKLIGPHYKIEIVGQKVCMTKTGPSLTDYKEYNLKPSDTDMTDMDFFYRICTPMIEMLNNVRPPAGIVEDGIPAAHDPDVLIH